MSIVDNISKYSDPCSKTNPRRLTSAAEVLKLTHGQIHAIRVDLARLPRLYIFHKAALARPERRGFDEEAGPGARVASRHVECADTSEGRTPEDLIFGRLRQSKMALVSQ